ncbi:MAG: motility associated factor glycosyltransferase family protein [Candidatus Glassbacteria bacterium]|nr:motility associated factor glycosyltransferase family protein [Candidatus Glassbacteria bacterium]
MNNRQTNLEIFRRNLQTLARVDQDLARRVAATHPAAAEIIATRAGVPSVRLSNAGGRPCTLVSTVNPLAEADRIVESQLEEGANSCLVYGFALGYHVERAIEKLPEGSRMLVVDPQISIFRLAMEVRDLTGLFANPDICWAIGEKEYEVPARFGQVFRVVTLEGVTVLAHKPTVKLCGEYFNELDQLCRKWLIAVGGNFLTNVSAVRTYLSNSLDNILSIVDHPPVRTLFNRFKGVPGIVIGAGPSLDRNIDLLRVLENHAVLICVDTSLGPLYRAGVRPHLALAGDASEANFRHLQGLGETGAALVAEPMTHPRIVEEFAGDKFIMSFNEVLMKKLGGILGDFGVVKAWGSISTGAFDLAVKLGCDPIVFVGQDLAFSDGRYYAHGTYQERRWLRELTYPKSLHDTHAWRMSCENALDVTDVFGRPQRTSKQLEAYRHYFEKEIFSATARVINATEGGAGFSEVENLPLEHVLWKYASSRRDVRKVIGKAHQARSQSEIDKLFDYLRQTTGELDSLQQLCNRGFESARVLHQGKSENRQAEYAALEEAYEQVYQFENIREMLENANQGGILTYQRGAEKLKGRELDDGLISEASQLYGSFFISCYQTVGLLRKKFEQASLSLGRRLSENHPEADEIPGLKETG